MQLLSSAFNHGDPLPERFAREEGNLSPPLTISQVPDGTASLLLIMEDPDAQHGTFTHWIVFNLAPNVGVLLENEVPPGARQGRNSFGDVGYGGPRPPSGTHRYFFHVYALDCPLDLPEGASRADVEAAMEQHVLENATLMGRYSAVPANVT